LPAPGPTAPAVDLNVAAGDSPPPQMLDGPAQPSPKASAVAQALLPALASAASAPTTAGELPTATLPVLPQAAAGSGAPDQNARPAPATLPIITSAAPSGPLPAAALAPPTLLSAEIHVADQPAGNVGPPREAESIPIPLPTPVAVRFPASIRANDNGGSDGGTDLLLGFAGGDVGGATTSNSPPGIAAPASFNPALPMMQAASAPVMPPQHAAGTPEMVPLAGIPIAIVARAEAGEKKFEIRLDPPDLGRIEVQLNVDSSGRATSHLVVDRADTLDLLRRDAPALERALQSAGLTTDDGALQFSLRDQSFAGRDQGAPAPVTPAAPVAAADSDAAPIDAALRRYGPPRGLGGGIDIRV
jgi:flagellar hook-length control protein FliK